MNRRLKKYLKQTVYITPWVSGDDYDDYTWGTEVAYACRIENVDTMIKNQYGKEAKSTCQIYLNAGAVVNYKSKIRDSIMDAPYPIIEKIEENQDRYGAVDHIVIYTR